MWFENRNRKVRKQPIETKLANRKTIRCHVIESAMTVAGRATVPAAHRGMETVFFSVNQARVPAKVARRVHFGSSISFEIQLTSNSE